MKCVCVCVCLQFPRCFTGETLFGVVGMGWFTHNIDATKAASMKALVSSRDQARRIVATTKSHHDEELEAYITGVQPSSVVRSGGCGGKVFLMLEGVADAYVFPKGGTKIWDTAAPEAILTAYGGRLTKPDNTSISYDRPIDGTFKTDFENRQGLIATHNGGKSGSGAAFHASFCRSGSV